jgi:hypothetical protein
MTPAMYMRLNRRLTAAARRFNVQALKALHPDLHGDRLYEAVGREEFRDFNFYEAMRTRIARGIARIDQDATLSRTERWERLDKLEAQERRYLEQHIEMASWRMAREEEMAQVQRASPEGGFWLLDESKKTHTEDCLAMEGRVWSWDTLREVNPANRHPGCGCRIITPDHARRLGKTPIRGHLSPSILDVMQEARFLRRIVDGLIYVPLRLGARGGNPYHFESGPKGGQFAPHTVTGIHGDVHPSVQPEVEELLSAAEDGGVDEIHQAFERALIAVKRLKPASVRDRNLRTLSRVRAAALNPEGTRVQMGSRPMIGGETRPVPLGVPERGMDTPWSKTGGFSWFVPASAMGENRERFVALLNKMGSWRMHDVEGGMILETEPSLSKRYALAAARHLEIISPQLRRNRIVEEGTGYADDRPLDLHPSEAEFEEDPEAPKTRYAHVPYTGVGRAAEALVQDSRDRLVALFPDLFPKGTEWEWPAVHRGAREEAVDWVIGEYAIEVKSEAMRGFLPFMQRQGSFSIDKAQRRRKLAWAQARGLKPALVTQVVDKDNDVSYVFFREYPESDEKIFGQHRIPQKLRQALIDGRLVPGMSALGKGEKDPAGATYFLGAIPLRYSSLRPTAVPGAKLQSQAAVPPGTAPTRAQALKIAGAPGRRPADVGVSGPATPPVPEPSPAAEPHRPAAAEDAYDEKVAEIIRRTEMGHSQSRIARDTGWKQNTISEILRRHAPHLRPGRGARQDVAPEKRGKRRSTKKEPKHLTTMQRAQARAEPEPEAPRRQIRATAKAAILELYDGDESAIDSIAAALGVEPSYVREVLRKAGRLAEKAGVSAD